MMIQTVNRLVPECDSIIDKNVENFVFIKTVDITRWPLFYQSCLMGNQGVGP